MNNFTPMSQSDLYHYYGNQQGTHPINKYVYIKQQAPKVLVNPHFKTPTVFVNPHFNNKIHINPVKFTTNQIYVNPNVIRSIPQNNIPTAKVEQKVPEQSRTIVSTRTKIIKVPVLKSSPSSVFKSVNVINSSVNNDVNSVKKLQRTRRKSIRSKYKIVKASPTTTNNLVQNKTPLKLFHKNLYKIDNTKKLIKIRRKYVYINKFANVSVLRKQSSLKPTSLKSRKSFNVVNINGVLYKKSTHSLRRASFDNKVKNRFKLVRKVAPKENVTFKVTNSKNIRKDTIKRYKIIRKTKPKLNSSSKFKKCNIPCVIYRKFGKCRAFEAGKCNKKHDPNQIMLCTRFLQGACVKKNCLLSHKVSPEKMPTCKYYLIGLCSKDDCPYLHVKINPKADICRDFLEGYCKLGVECDKRHQLLCPDFERLGSCPKKRCAYPHGNLVRKYCANKNFTKKSSIKNNETDAKIVKAKSVAKLKNKCNEQSNRYYEENKEEIKHEKCDTVLPNLIERPKIGTLPSFIPFTNSVNKME